jgi:hypothetical protein
VPSAPNAAARKFGLLMGLSLLWKIAAIAVVFVLVVKLTGGF